MNVVYIINIATDRKPGRTAPYKFGIESWKLYCDKHNDNDVFLPGVYRIEIVCDNAIIGETTMTLQ